MVDASGRKIKNRLITPVLMWLIVAVGVFACFKTLPAVRLFDAGGAGRIVLVLGLCYWGWLFFGAGCVNRSIARSAAGVSSLSIEGVYRRVRHPIYSGDIVLSWAIALNWPQTWVIVSTVWMNLVLFCWMRLEEHALIERFGDDYRDYQSRTPMFIPMFGRK